MGFLKNIFASKEAQFQQKVLNTLRNNHPSLDFQPGENVNQVLIEKRAVNISDLRLQCAQNEYDTTGIIQHFFSHPVALSNPLPPVPRTEAKQQIKPQIVPAIFLQGLNVLHRPLVDGLEIGLVFSPEEAFLRSQDLASWGLHEENVFSQALQNLASEQFDMEVTITDGIDRFIGLENDPFSAARILLPHVRKTAAEKLGEPYLAGIPNRSFLILWSSGCSKRFQEYAIEKVQSDFAKEPFALTSQILEVTTGAARIFA